jgi:hypothetical protein
LSKADSSVITERAKIVDEAHQALLKEAEDEEAKTSSTGMPTVPHVLKSLRQIMPKETTILSEAISNYRE